MEDTHACVFPVYIEKTGRGGGGLNWTKEAKDKISLVLRAFGSVDVVDVGEADETEESGMVVVNFEW